MDQQKPGVTVDSEVNAASRALVQTPSEGEAETGQRSGESEISEHRKNSTRSPAAEKSTSGEREPTIQNPYYANRAWAVWTLDDPEQVTDLPGDFELSKQSDRIYPMDGFLTSFTNTETESVGAGFWDDVYVSQDKFHSRLSCTWEDGSGKSFDFKNQIPILKRGYYTFDFDGKSISSPATDELRKIGATFTSQSTTGMGHNIANHPLLMLVNEREFYFANILRCGPAHSSFNDSNSGASADAYQALVPSLFNSIGSSGSEVWALNKFAIAGAHLSADVKQLAKKHGLYAATLLYLWKVSLPYDAPYENGIRHRVAYFADGQDRSGRATKQTGIEVDAHTYDDERHLRNMVDHAAKLSAVPPIPIANLSEVEGGSLVYGLASCALIHQEAEPVRFRVSTHNSFDVQDLPVNVRASVLFGTPGSEAVRINDHEFQVTIPAPGALSNGRTAIAFIANNGVSDSNPMVVNVFRKLGGPNQRPHIEVKGEASVRPGAVLRLSLATFDPEGQKVKVYKTSESPGQVQEDAFVWHCPADEQTGIRNVHLIASDDSSGSSLNGITIPVAVQAVIPRITSERTDGPVPLQVQFSSETSGYDTSKPTSFAWDFGDGNRSREANPKHVFRQPGFHKVQLAAVQNGRKAGLSKTTFHAAHNWPLQIDNGWNDTGVNNSIWLVPDALNVSIAGKSEAATMLIKSLEAEPANLTCKTTFKPPCYIETTYIRHNNAENAGLQVFGSVVGRGPDPSRSTPIARDSSFSFYGPEKGGQAKSIFLLPAPKSMQQPTTIRLYVLPSHEPELASFSGCLSGEAGIKFFQIKDVRLRNNEIGWCPGKRGTVLLSEFRVWAPDGT